MTSAEAKNSLTSLKNYTAIAKNKNSLLIRKAYNRQSTNLTHKLKLIPLIIHKNIKMLSGLLFCAQLTLTLKQVSYIPKLLNGRCLGRYNCRV